MPRLRTVGPVIAIVVAACGQSTSLPGSASPRATVPPSAMASPTPVAAAGSSAGSPRELVSGTDPLPPGTYTRTGFLPPLTLALDEGWTVGTVSNGFFDVQRDRGTPDVIAVQLALVDGVVGPGGSPAVPTTAAVAVEAIRANPGLTVIDESGSRLGGLDGLNVVVENKGSAHAAVLDVSAGRLGIDPGRRLWISLFDTPDGLLAVMVGGSVAQWERALSVAEPVLESIDIGG